eukprot:COSAG05_NODE_9092_length_648_cov_1.111111_1_plen_55_part_10
MESYEIQPGKLLNLTMENYSTGSWKTINTLNHSDQPELMDGRSVSAIDSTSPVLS